MNSEASDVLQKLSIEIDENPPGICLYNPSWHEGLVGLVASRLKEKWSVPVIAFARGDSGDLKGSARSVTGVHIRDVLCEIDAENPHTIIRFGGHAMAAGLTIGESRFVTFKKAWLQRLETRRDDIEAANTVLSDGELNQEIDDLGFIRNLKIAAPWGQGFSEPIFDNKFQVMEQRLVGEIHLKMTLRPLHEDRTVEAIRFRHLDAPGAPCIQYERIHAAYRVDINEYAGRVSPQLLIEHFQPC
jgi:single-stranded-DNA-specific exonuclease